MRGNITAHQREKLAAELALLKSLDFNQLRARWKTLYETPAQRRFSRKLLMSAVVYRMQERVLGGLSLSTRLLLARVAEQIRRARDPDWLSSTD